MDKHENEEKQQFLWLSNILPEFMKIYRKEKNKQPYHINLIDELHTRASENAHSRILAKLLQQKSLDGKFEILESFIRYITERSVAFGNIKVEKPIITQEKERIDLCIIEKNYAIIIENKVNYAPDQEKQLERYIDRVWKKYCVDLNQIFIIYLAHDDKDLDNQTLGEYKNKIGNRLQHLSFKDDVLSWLSNSVLPNVRLKDEYLSSALQQYIDHLKGMFNLREIDKIMNKELQEYIKKEFGIDSNKPEEGLKELSDKKDALEKVLEQIDLLAKEIRLSYFPKWKKELEKDFENYKDKIPDKVKCEIINEDDHSLTLEIYTHNIKHVEFSVVLYYDHLDGFRYGINLWNDSLCNTKRPEVGAFVQDILNEFHLNYNDNAWYGYQYINDDHFSTDNVYSKFKELVDKTIEEVIKENTKG